MASGDRVASRWRSAATVRPWVIIGQQRASAGERSSRRTQAPRPVRFLPRSSSSGQSHAAAAAAAAGGSSRARAVDRPDRGDGLVERGPGGEVEHVLHWSVVGIFVLLVLGLFLQVVGLLRHTRFFLYYVHIARFLAPCTIELTSDHSPLLGEAEATPKTTHARPSLRQA